MTVISCTIYVPHTMFGRSFPICLCPRNLQFPYPVHISINVVNAYSMQHSPCNISTETQTICLAQDPINRSRMPLLQRDAPMYFHCLIIMYQIRQIWLYTFVVLYTELSRNSLFTNVQPRRTPNWFWLLYVAQKSNYQINSHCAARASIASNNSDVRGTYILQQILN